MLSPFGARSSRNTPSNAKLVFGPHVWIRCLIKPPPGTAVAYLDYSQQEFAIAAALSGDKNMMQAYRSGDPYLTFAKQTGAVPPDATRETHGAQRDLFKTAALAVQYGQGAYGLAFRLDKAPIAARDLIMAHKQTYRRFWEWSDAAIDQAMIRSELATTFGWKIHIGIESNPRSLRNFPMQANGADMLRIACMLATERGIAVCCPIHDALLIMAPVDRIEADVDAARKCMIEASEAVLPGFPLRVDQKIVRYPDRYIDGRGEDMWNEVMQLLDQADERHRRSA
jgi:DNA polymerase I-like protein with 3'-5' exonuclease and polymerase domains